MPDKNTVEIIIKATTDKALADVKQFTNGAKQGFEQAAGVAEQAGIRMTSAWNTAKAAWVEIAALSYIVKKAWDFAYDAAMFQERKQAFTNMAASMGADANALMADLKRLSRGTISEFQLMEKAGTAMTMDIPAENLKGLMEIARATAKVTGQTVEKAFGDIALGVARQSRMILDNLGIMVNVEQANKDYARALGKTAEQLTGTERKQAFLNKTMEAGEIIVKNVGSETDSAAEAMQRYQARIANAKNIVGNAILSWGMAWQGLFVAIGAGFNDLFAIIENRYADILSVGSHLPGFGKYFDDASKQARGWAEQSALAAKEGWDQFFDIGDVIAGLWSDVKVGSGIAARKQKADVDATAEAERKALDDRLKKYVGFYNEVKAQQKEAFDSYKKGLLDIQGIEEARYNARRKVEDLLLEAEGKTREGYEAFERQKEDLIRTGWQAEDATGKRRIELLDQYMTKAAQMAKEFKEGTEQRTGQGIIQEMTEALRWAAEEQDRAYAEMSDSAAKKAEADRVWAEELTQTLDQVRAQIDSLKAAAKEKAQIDFDIAEGMDKIRLIQAELAAIKDKTVHVNVVYSQSGGGSAGGNLEAEIPAWEEKWGIDIGTSPAPEPADSYQEGRSNVGSVYGQIVEGVGNRSAFPSYQGGTDYVPRTGLYELHEGEKVVPKDKSRGVTIMLGGVTIYGGSGGLVKQLDEGLAREIKYGRSKISAALMAAGLA